MTYTLEVFTGDKPGAETDYPVFVTLTGSQGDSGKRILYHSLNNTEKFRRGQKDVFTIECVDLETIEDIDIGCDGTCCL